MRRRIGILIMVLVAMVCFLYVPSGHSGEKGWEKTVTLPSGEVILDLNGEWDDQIENYGPWSLYGNYTNVIKFTLEGNSFVGIRMKTDQWNSQGSMALRGVLDKDGIKEVQIMSQMGPIDAKVQISEDGNRIIIDDGEKARLTLIRK